MFLQIMDDKEVFDSLYPMREKVRNQRSKMTNLHVQQPISKITEKGDEKELERAGASQYEKRSETKRIDDISEFRGVSSPRGESSSLEAEETTYNRKVQQDDVEKRKTWQENRRSSNTKSFQQIMNEYKLESIKKTEARSNFNAHYSKRNQEVAMALKKQRDLEEQQEKEWPQTRRPRLDNSPKKSQLSSHTEPTNSNQTQETLSQNEDSSILHGDFNVSICDDHITITYEELINVISKFHTL